MEKQLISGLSIKRLTQNIDGELTKQNRNSTFMMIINPLSVFKKFSEIFERLNARGSGVV